MATDRQPPQDIDTDRPSPARVYDYLLGGGHNFAADRRLAEQLLVTAPDAPATAHANRAFLRRAVRYVVDAGIHQFLDIGSGIPTVGHVHEIAQAEAPTARVVYVDVDPIAVAHSRHILAGNALATALQADAREPEAILASDEVRDLLDLSRPVAVLAVALFQLIGDADDPHGIMHRLTAPLVGGSHLVLSHHTADGTEGMERYVEVFRRSGITMTLRTRVQIEAMFAGWDLVPPGLVPVRHWRPDAPPDRTRPSAPLYAGVARKP